MRQLRAHRHGRLDDDRRRPCASTASCARPATTTSASCCRPRCIERSPDIDALADLKPSVRICKGIYVESPEIQFHDFDAVQREFRARARGALRCGSASGDRDARRMARSKRRSGSSRSTGSTRERLRVPDAPRGAPRSRRLARRGRPPVAHLRPVRCATGTSTRLRRLQENPSIAGYIAHDSGRTRLHPPGSAQREWNA